MALTFWSKRWTLVVALVCVVAIAATVLVWLRVRAADAATLLADGEEITAQVTTANGGVLDLGVFGTVRIPPGAVDHDGLLRARRNDRDAPPIDEAFMPLGPSVQVDLEGAELVGDAMMEFTVRPPTSESGDPLTPVGLYFDEAQRRWITAESSDYDAAGQRVVVRTKHFSWWGVFTWNWDWTRRQAKGLIEGTFSDGQWIAGASAPKCENRKKADERARSLGTAGNPLTSKAIPGGDHLLWCPDVDADDQLVMRVVNNRRMAIAVKLLSGLELVPRTVPRPHALKHVGPRVDEYLHAQEGIPATVVGHGEEVTLRVTNLFPRAYAGTAPSAWSYATDIIDIGYRLLALTYVNLSSTPVSESDAYKLLEKFNLGNCLANSLHEKSVVGNPTDVEAINRSVGELLISCASETLADAYLSGQLQGGVVVAARVVEWSILCSA